MKKIVGWIIGILVILVGGFFILNSYIYNEKQVDNETDNGPIIVEDFEGEATFEGLAKDFADAMFEAGTADGLIPIEGFDADLLLSKFPGLIPEDFEGVEAFEGVYTVEGGEWVFTRTKAQPVSSAERTVSTQGYATLLENVSTRLDHPVRTLFEIDSLIEKLLSE